MLINGMLMEKIVISIEESDDGKFICTTEQHGQHRIVRVHDDFNRLSEEIKSYLDTRFSLHEARNRF